MARASPAPAPIGDVVRALTVLGFEGRDTLTTVLKALGWQGDAAAPVYRPIAVPPAAPPTTLALPAPSAPPAAEQHRPRPSTVTRLASPATTEPAWLVDVLPLPLPDPNQTVPLYAKPIEPLFPPLITRAILTRLAAASAPVGDVDEEALVDTVARGRALTALPRRCIPTLAKGLVLLIDDGPGMDPFSNDIAGLIDDLGLAVGRDRLTIETFRGCPSDGVADALTATKTPFSQPPPGTPLLVVTDFGRAQWRSQSVPSREDDWLAWARELRNRGTPLAVLMPCSPARVPPALRRLNTVTWDRRTGARLNERRAKGGTAAETDGAERLARLASVAGRIDPQLLRSLRLHVVRDVGVEAEADLWFSRRLAQSAAITGIVLKPEEQRRLQDDLARAEGDLLTRVWELTFRLRTGRPWSDRDRVTERTWLLAQEELTYWALKGLGGNGAGRAAAEERLKQILKTLITAAGSARERDAVVWTTAARSRLPPDVMDLEPMRHLLLGAALRGAKTVAPEDMGAITAAADIPQWLVPGSTGARLSVWVRFVDGGVEASLDELPHAHPIETLALKPLLMAVRWDANGSREQRTLRLNPPRAAYCPLDADSIEISLPDGARYEVSHAPGTILINLPPPPDLLLGRQAELRAAVDALTARPSDVSTEPPDRPLRVFISYSSRDDQAKIELETALRPLRTEGLIEFWTDILLPPGEDWSSRIQREVAHADILVVLLGPDLLASEWAAREFELARPRAADGTLRVIVIVTRECNWRSSPFSTFQTLPRGGRPIMDVSDPTSRTMAWMEVADAFETSVRSLRAARLDRQANASRPRMIALTGPGGIGRFTLARALVHEPEVHARYSDGIVWLGEDGMGYPRQWLRDYCAAAQLSAPFDGRGIVDRDAFRALFAGRHVLFVAAFPSASDMLPTLAEHAGPGCSILLLTERTPTAVEPERRAVITLAPLPIEAAVHLLEASGVTGFQASVLAGSGKGNPFLLRLSAVSIRLMPPDAPPVQGAATIEGERRAQIRYARETERIGQANLPIEAVQERVRGSAAALWRPDGTPSPEHASLLLKRRALVALIQSSPRGTVFPRSDFVNVADDLAELISLGLLDDLGPQIRLHPLLRDTIEAPLVFRDVDAFWCPELVALPAGEFLMGSPEDEDGHGSDEAPRHPVTIGHAFGIGRTPVTVAQYRQFATTTGHRHTGGMYVVKGSEGDYDEAASWENPGFEQGDSHPVVGVSWLDSRAYCDWLSKETNKHYRLPSEAEWEYACRAGTTTRYATGDTITEKDANFGDLVGTTTEVGAYPPNTWGLYDMHGNVWEWVEDVWHDTYAGAPVDGSAWKASTEGKGLPSSREVVRRGGHWLSNQKYLRAAYRNWHRIDERVSGLGFRVARTLD